MSSRLLLTPVLALALWLGPGCGKSGGTGTNNNNNNRDCPADHEPSGPACLPVFDECPGDAEVAVLGGGCTQIGVTQCATGFTADGAGGCDPVLPAEPCPTGTMEVIGSTECQPVGIRQCADGFVANGEGGCDAVLPAAPCGPGTIALLGYADCQPLGDCSTGTWGTITPDATTVYVDANYSGGNSDGSDASPFTTITDALSAAVDGAQIAVAAGTYAEPVTVDRPVRLRGRCAELATIDAGDATAVTFAATAAGSTISGFTITSLRGGVRVEGATGIQLAHLMVTDTGEVGISVRGGAEVTVSESVVNRGTGYGILSTGSDTVIDRSVIRDGQPWADETYGMGVGAYCESNLVCGSITLQRSLVSGNRDTGVFVGGVVVSVSGSVIRDTQTILADDSWGYGIYVFCDIELGICNPVDITGSLVMGNTDAGIGFHGPTATIHSTEVRNTQSLPVAQSGGWGIFSQCNRAVNACGHLTVTDSLVTDNRETGVAAIGVDMTIASTVVRNNRSADSGAEGRGILAQCFGLESICGVMHVSDSLVEGNDEAGIMVAGADAVIARTVVRDSQPRQNDDEAGMGVGIYCFPFTEHCGHVVLDHTLVSGNLTAGIYAMGPDVTIRGSVVRDSLPRVSDDDGGWGIGFLCDASIGVCGGLRIDGAVFERNADAAIGVTTGDATITGTVVRDTQPGASGEFGRGIAAWCNTTLRICRPLRITDCLVEGSRDVGLFVSGVDAIVARTVVRDTLPELLSGMFGRGLEAHCDHRIGACGSLQLSDSLIQGSENLGLLLTGYWTVLEGVTVRDTRPNRAGDWQDDFGQGILSTCADFVDTCGFLEMTGCRVVSSYTGGVAVEGVSGRLTSSVILGVGTHPVDGTFGYGVQVAGKDGGPMTLVNIDACRIADAPLAGILYHLAGGTLGRTSISGGEFSVAMNQGSAPTIEETNQLSGSSMSEPTWTNMDAAPAPGPALPSEITD